MEQVRPGNPVPAPGAAAPGRGAGPSGAERPAVPGTNERAARVPAQPSVSPASQTRRTQGRPGPDGPARGEHTHSEPPAPVIAARPAPDRAPPAVRPEGDPDCPLARKQPRRSSVRGQVLDGLRAALIGGELEPGEVYSAPALGESFGVSATPVREAMQQLAVEGAVEVVPNRGFRVIERGPRELAELAEVRALIEVPVMLRLARTVPAEQWTGLRPLAEETVVAASCGDRARYADSDRAFHQAVLSLSGNQQLVAVADDLHRRSQWPLVTGPLSHRRADLIADAAEHMALLVALAARDLPVVQSLVREHFAGAAGSAGATAAP